MSGISAITRDWGIVPCIVRIVTSDSLASVGASGYITAQAHNISVANNGAFSWLASDSVLVYASDGSALFTISSDFSSLLPIQPLSASVSLTAAQVLGMYGAPVLLVPAAPAGTINLVTSAAWDIHFNSAQYAAGGVIAIQYDSTVHGAGTPASTTIAAATLNGVAASTILTMTQPASIALASAVAKGLYLSNQTAAFTTGDSASKIVVRYYNFVVV